MKSCCLPRPVLSRLLSPFTRTGGAFVSLLAALALAVSGRAAGNAPAISPPFANQTYYAEPRVATERVINFTFDDADTSATAFVNNASIGARITAISDNPNLILPADMAVAIGATGKARTLTIKHQPNITGVANVTVTISDGTNQSTAIFTVTVVPTPQYYWGIVAGSPAGTAGSANGTGTAATFNGPNGMVKDSQGNLYVSDYTNQVVRKITPQGVVTTFVGAMGTSGFADGTGTAAKINNALQMVIDANDNLYLADGGNHRIRKITPGGEVTTIAGAGTAGSVDGAALSATFNVPSGIALDPATGALYVSEASGHVIRKIENGQVTTIAGLAATAANTDGVGSAARFNQPHSMVRLADGNLLVKDVTSGNYRGLNPVTAAVTTLTSGNSNIYSYSGVDAQGNLYLPLTSNLLTLVSSFDTVNLVGTGTAGSALGVNTAATIADPREMVFNADGSIYLVSRGQNNIRVGTPIASLKNPGTQSTTEAARLAFNSTELEQLGAVSNAVDGSNNPLPITLTLSAQFGTLDFNNGPAPNGVTVSFATGNRSVTLVGNETAVNAYLLNFGYTPDAGYLNANTNGGTLASGAVSPDVLKMSVTTANNVNAPVVGSLNLQVRATNNKPRIITQLADKLYLSQGGGATEPAISLTIADADTAVTAFVNNATTGARITATSDNPNLIIPADMATALGGTGTARTLTIKHQPNITGVANVTVTMSDGVNQTTSIFKVTVLPGPAYYWNFFVGDTTGLTGTVDAAGNTARFNAPTGMVKLSSGDYLVSDASNNLIRRVTPQGVVTTYAGSTTSGTADGAMATAGFKSPRFMAVDSIDNVYVADTGNHTIRMINTVNGTVSTVAGLAGSTGTTDGAAIGTARLNAPYGLALSPAGVLYFTDSGNNTVRKLENGVVTTLAGDPASASNFNQDGTGKDAHFWFPKNITFSPRGTLIINDTNLGSYREMTTTGVVTTLLANTSGNSYHGAAAFDPNGSFWYSSKNAEVSVDGFVIAGNGTPAAQVGLKGDARLRYAQGSLLFESNRVLLVDTGNHAVRSGQPIQMLYNPGKQSIGDTQLFTFSNPANQRLAIQSNGAAEPLSLTLTVTKGTISLGRITGLSFTAGDGTADATMTFSGTVANINAALTDLVYDFNEVANPSATSDTLTMSTPWTVGATSGTVTQVVPLQIGKAPLVSSITDIAVPTGVAPPTRFFVMVDGDNSPSQVQIVLSSSNASLLPLSGITLTPGPGASSTTVGATGNYSLTFTPTQGSTGSSIVTVTATDPAGFKDTKSFTVEVGSLKASIGAITSTSAVINAEVTSDAGATITERGVVYALASAASDPKKGDTGVTAVTTSGTLGVYTITLSGLAPNSVYVARSYAINSIGSSYSSVLTFSTNLAPVITSNGGSATAAISVAENVSAVTMVTATDADTPAQTLTYAIDGGTDAAKFAINATSGVLTFVAAPDFETPADAGADNVYNLTVAVTDNGNAPKSATQALTITVTNVAETPALAAPTAISVIATWATLGGTVTTNGGGGTITEQGIVYAVTSSNATPQIGGSGVTKVASTGASLSVALTGLAKETTYAYRSYAINATGTGYSTVGTFTTAGDASLPAFSYGAVSGRTFNLNDAITPFSPAQGGGALTGGVYLNVTTVVGTAGSGNVDAATTATAKVNGPRGLALAANGDLYFADSGNHRIRRITAAGGVETVVGSSSGFSDTTGSVKFNQPIGLVIDRVNNVLYIADHNNHRIRKVNLGVSPVTVSTIAGSGTAGAADGTGTTATLNKPVDLALNTAGTILYVTEYGSHIVRKITLATGTVDRVAGGAGSTGSANGDALTAARFNGPAGIAVDPAGNLYVADFNGHLVRKITAAGVVSTLAGTGSIGATDGVGTGASFNQPGGLQLDGAGNLYVAEANSNRIRRITPAGDVVTLIGTGYSGTADGVGRASSVGGPMSLLVDPTGVMYVSDTATSRIRRVQLAGYTLSHPLPAGMTFDPATGRIGGTPTEASLQTVFANDFSTGLGTGTVNNDAVRRGDAVELTPNAGNKFGGFSVPASGTAGGVVKVNFSLITTKASGGADGVSWSFADDTNATDTAISSQSGTGTKLAVSFDNFNNGSTGGIGVRVVYGPKVSGLPNSVSGAVKGFSNSTAWIGTAVPVSITTTTDGKTTVTMAGTEVLSGIALDAAYAAADKSTWKHVFKGATGGSSDLHAIDDLVIQQGAGMATYTVTAYNFYGSSSATLELKTEVGPLAATFASGGDVGQTRAGFTDNLTLGTLTLGFAPTLGQKLTLVNNTGSAASTGRFTGLAEGGTVTANYNGDTFTFTITYAGGTGNDVVLERVLATGQSLQAVGEVTTLAGSSSGSADGTGTAAQFNEPTGVAVDGSGNVYVADKSNHRIRKITAGGVVTTLAGSTPGFADGAGTAARFRSPHGVAVDRSGNVYVGDYENHRIRKITAGGVVTTLTGSTQGFADGARNTAKFRGVKGVALDGSGNVYVADMFNHRIRKITADGVVSTPAGALQGFADGTGFSAQFKFPDGVAVDGSGNVYVADWLNYRIRKITAGGVVTTLAGSSSYGFADGAGAAAKFAGPIGVAVDGSGNVYVVEDRMHRVRKITAGGVVTTLAGSSDFGYADSTGASAKFWNTQGVAVDGSGQIYVAEIGNHLIRKISPGDARPIVTAAAATAVGASTAVLNGTVNPNGLMTTAVFEYGTTTSYGSTAAVTLTPNNGTAAQTVASAALTGLAGNTTYFYRLKATNVDGTAVTASGTFSTTALGKPSVLVASASAITATGATVSGSVSSDGGTAITERGVAYRVSGSGSPFTKVLTTGTTGAWSVGLTGLTAATTYDVQAYAVNTVGESVGESTSLTTLKAVAVAAAPTITSVDPAGNAISVNFTAGADGGAAITNYKYSLDGGTTWIAFSPAVTTSPVTITGLTAGTPYNVQVRAVTSAGDGVASTTQSVTLRSKLVITSAATAMGTYGTPFTYTITAAGSPTSFSATGLPTGLAVAPGTGVISGTPTQAGSFNVTLGAATGTGTTQQTLSITIAKAALTVTADNASRAFGQENPAFTATISGFVLGDTAAVVSGAAEFTTTATTDSVTGSYPITPAVGSLSAAPYRFVTFTPGSLSVGKQTATVTLGNLAQTYDGTARAAKATTSPDAVTVGLSYAGTGGTTYGPSATAPTNAGSYTVTATINDTKFTGTATGTLVVAKASQTITISPLPTSVALNTIATGTVAIAATASSGLPVSFSLDTGSAAGVGLSTTGSPSTLTSLGGSTGTVKLIATQVGNANYDAASTASADFEVTKANQQITFTGPTDQAFNATSPTVSLAATTDATGLTVGFTVVSGPASVAGSTLTLTGAGKVFVRASQSGDGTYNAAPSVDQVFAVTRSVQSQTITFPAITGVTYGVAPFALAATASSTLPVTFVVVSGPATVATSGGVSTLTITGAGSVTVQASQTGNDDFSAATPVERSFTVSPKALTVASATAQSKSYDGTNAAVIAGATLTGAVSGDSVGLGKATEGTFGQTGVGTNLAVATAMTLTGADAANYTLTQPSGLTASITGITLTVSGVTVADKIYDGAATATASFTNAKLIGLAAADVGSVIPNSTAATATFAGAAGKAAGTGKTVNITGLTLTGAAAANYTLTPPTATADISRKTIYVTGVTVADRTYNGSRTAALAFSSAALSGVVSPDVVTVDSSGAAGLFESAEVGTDKGIAITGVTLGGTDKDNYTVGQPSARASITPKELTVAGITVTPRAYNGGVTGTLVTTGASLVGVESGDTANVTLVTTGAVGEYADALVGTGKTVQVTGLFLTGTRAGNYKLTQPAVTGAVTGQPVSVTGIQGINKLYDGTTVAQLDTRGATLVGASAGSGVALSVTGATGAFATAVAGTNKTVQVSGLTLEGPSAANFTLTQPTATASITTPTLTVSGVSAASKVYDRTTTATVNVSDVRLEGVVSGDTVTVVTTGATGTFDTRVAGKNKTVTFAGLVLAGADAAKYTLQQPSVSADITPQPLSVAGVTVADKVYDATLETAASFIGATLNGVIAGDSVALNPQFAAASFADKNVGNGKALTVSGLALSGADAANYSVGTVSSSASVTKATLTVDGVVAGTIIYGSGLPAPLDFSAAQLVGVMPQDDVALVSSAATGAFDNLNAGGLKTVTLSGLTLTGVDAGNYTLTAPVPTGTILQAVVSFTLGSPVFVYDGSPKVVAALATPLVPYLVTYAENGRALAAPPTNVGTYDVYAAVSDSNYSGNASATLTIRKATQTIALEAPTTATLADTIPVKATSSSGLPVAVSVTGPATLVQGALRFTAPGTVVITASQAGNANYAEASATAVVTVAGKAGQTIAFTAPGDRLSNSGPLTLSATASSGLPVTFSVVSGPALITSNVVTLRGDAGRVVVRAAQAGDARFEAALDVTVSFEVTAATVNVFFGNVTAPGTGGASPKVGDIAAALPPNSNRGSLLVVAPSVGLNRALDFQLNLDGTFEQTFIIDGPAAVDRDTPPVAAAPLTIKVKGRLVGGRLSGTVEPLGLAFDAPVQPVVGTSANAAGFYRSSTLANTTGATYSIVGTNSQVLVLASTPAVTTGGLTTLGSDGTFALQTSTTAGAATIRGTVDEPTTTVAGSISLGGTTTQFAGLATTTARTDRLVNLSSRVRIGGGDSVLITGFVIGGTAPKQVLVRGIGPALTGFGLGGALANPKLKIYRGSTLISENDDWSADAAGAFSRVGAFGLTAGSRDAALVATLEPGAYTAHVSDGGAAGVALAEIYDASVNPAGEYQRLINISTRGEVTAGEGVLIGGFVVTGNSPKRLLIRGVGPGLAAFGVAGVLADPRVRVYRNADLQAENDNWSAVAVAGTAAADAAREAGAFALAAGSRDAALIVSLAPGAYTVQITSTDGTATGVALIELYELP